MRRRATARHARHAWRQPTHASFLTSLVDARHGRGLKSDEILLSMLRADIASYLVLAVETVSRSLARLQEAGSIEVHRNRIRILDEEALRATAGGVDPEAAPCLHRAVVAS